MKNIIIVIIISISLIFSAYIIRDGLKYNQNKQESCLKRFKVVVDASTPPIKYDSGTGKTWMIGLPNFQWVEIKDYGWIYSEPKKDE